MKRLFFVRHGETHMNVARTFSGRSETSLTKKGTQQAKETGLKIKNTIPTIDLMICSPYKRTCETAKYIAREIDYPIEKIIENDLFIERSYGVLEGTQAVKYILPNKHSDVDHIKDVETLENLQIRAVKALEYIESLKDFDNILIVSHGAFGRALRRAVRKLPHTHELKDYEPINNAEIVELI